MERQSERFLRSHFPHRQFITHMTNCCLQSLNTVVCINALDVMNRIIISYPIVGRCIRYEEVKNSSLSCSLIVLVL